MDLSKTSLAAAYAEVCRLSDPTRTLVAQLDRLGHACETLEERTLISGALPGEFQVVLMFRRIPGYPGTRSMQPVLI